MKKYLWNVSWYSNMAPEGKSSFICISFEKNQSEGLEYSLSGIFTSLEV